MAARTTSTAPSIPSRNHTTILGWAEWMHGPPALIGGAPFAHRVGVRYPKLSNPCTHAFQPVQLHRHDVRNVELEVLNEESSIVLLRIEAAHAVTSLEAVRGHKAPE